MIDIAELKALIEQRIKDAERAALEAERARVRAVGGQIALRNLLKQIEATETDGDDQSDDLHT